MSNTKLTRFVRCSVTGDVQRTSLDLRYENVDCLYTDRRKRCSVIATILPRTLVAFTVNYLR